MIKMPTTQFECRQAERNRKGRAFAATTALVAGATATLILASKGKLNPVEGGNKTVEAIKKALKGPADKAIDFIAGSKTIAKCAQKVGEFQHKIAPKFNPIKEKVLADAETLAANVEGVIKGNAPKFNKMKENAVADIETFVANVEGTIKGNAPKFNKMKENVVADIETFVANAEGTVKGFAQKESTKKAVAFVKEIPTKVSKFLAEFTQKAQ